jgi:hypothetical protein
VARRGIVPDHASRIRDVVLVRRVFSSGNPRGSGIWNRGGGGDGKGMERGRSAYEQPGTKVDGILSRQGGFPSTVPGLETDRRKYYNCIIPGGCNALWFCLFAFLCLVLVLTKFQRTKT